MSFVKVKKAAVTDFGMPLRGYNRNGQWIHGRCGVIIWDEMEGVLWGL
jgi:hypothetical protein